MKNFLTPTAVVLAALILSGGVTFLSGGKINWEGLGKDAITYYFVYLRGTNEGKKVIDSEKTTPE